MLVQTNRRLGGGLGHMHSAMPDTEHTYNNFMTTQSVSGGPQIQQNIHQNIMNSSDPGLLLVSLIKIQFLYLD